MPTLLIVNDDFFHNLNRWTVDAVWDALYGTEQRPGYFSDPTRSDAAILSAHGQTAETTLALLRMIGPSHKADANRSCRQCTGG